MSSPPELACLSYSINSTAVTIPRRIPAAIAIACWWVGLGLGVLHNDAALRGAVWVLLPPPSQKTLISLDGVSLPPGVGIVWRLEGAATEYAHSCPGSILRVALGKLVAVFCKHLLRLPLELPAAHAHH